MTLLPIAHAGHWAIALLYAVPVVIVLGSVARTMLRDRRQPPSDEADDGPE